MDAQKTEATASSSPFPLRGVFLAAAVVSGAAGVLTFAIGRFPTATTVASLSLFAMSGLLAVLAKLSSQRAIPRGLWTLMIVIALLISGPAHFFGPNSGFAAVVALLFVFVGLLSRSEESNVSWAAAISVCGVVSLCQLLLVVFPLIGWISDSSLVPVAIPGHPDWHHYIAHFTLQTLYVGSFLVGRVLRRRYISLSHEVEIGLREAAVQRALAAEARLEYQAALSAARDGIFSGQTVGRYEMGPLISRDDTGELYDGLDSETDTQVTVRVVHQLGASGPVAGLAIGIGGSALAVSGLDSPLQITGSQEGLTLSGIVSEDGALPEDDLRNLVFDIATQLEALHASSSFHLEVSPRLVRRKGSDFVLGAAGLGGQPRASDMAFSAPERFTAPIVDGRADVYSLCATVYYAIAASTPFADLDAVTIQSGRGLPRYPPCAKALADVLRVGLAQDPTERFQTTSETRTALLAAIGGSISPELELRAADLDEVETWREQPLSSLQSASPPQTASELVPVESGDSVPASAWLGAYRDKMKFTTIGLTAVCMSGAGLFAIIIRDRIALLVGLLCLLGIVAAAWLYRRLGRTGALWPWIASALLAMGPAYSIGINSAFASFVVVFMFSSALFEPSRKGPRARSRLMVLAAMCLGTIGLSSAILFGLVPDASNVVLRQPGAPLSETLILLTLQVGTYIASFAVGRAIDIRYESLAGAARAASRNADSHAASLSEAREELKRLLTTESVGLFTALQVGDYVVGRLLGRGGMGEVYEARHQATGIQAALKVLRFDKVSEPSHLRLFLREAETLSQISSPHVAGVLEVGDFEAGLPFIAMEFVDGDVLGDLLSEQRTLEKSLVREMVADIGAGLAAVHRARVVHRDIKPANIILTKNDLESRWKLVDFGVASIGLDPDSRKMILGTPRYMSPEQAAGGETDARSDLYSLCLVVYRALTGCPAFTGADPSEILRATRDTGIANPRSFAPLSLDLEVALRIGLARDPANRFATADELRDVFEDAFAERLDATIRERGIELLAREPWSAS